MKKYLITGGFAAVLLLGACGVEEPEAADEQTEDYAEDHAEDETSEEQTEE